jgi:transcriptional regulator with XRE-family HTH domain
MRRVVPTPFPADPAVVDPAAFGALIRAARTHSGISLSDAAARLGVSKQTMFDLEKATASVGLSIALRAARVLGLTMLALPSAEGEPARRLLAGMRRRAAGKGRRREAAVLAAHTVPGTRKARPPRR